MVKNISKNTISTIRQLHSGKHRRESGLFIAEGEKIINELLKSNFNIRLIACLPDFYEQYLAKENGFEVCLVNDQELSKISLMQTPNKVLALVEFPAPANVDYSIKGVYLLLDGIRDPGNMGTIIRSAEWFGVKAVICSPDCVDHFSPKVVQGSMGSIFRMTVISHPLSEMIGEFKSAGEGIVLGAVLEGKPLRDLSTLPESVMIAIGNESHGISKEVTTLLDQKVTIAGASLSPTESLNAAVACGILLYHISTK